MFYYLTKISIINLKEFTVDSINYLGWESNLSIRAQNTACGICNGLWMGFVYMDFVYGLCI